MKGRVQVAMSYGGGTSGEVGVSVASAGEATATRLTVTPTAAMTDMNLTLQAVVQATTLPFSGGSISFLKQAPGEASFSQIGSVAVPQGMGSPVLTGSLQYRACAGPGTWQFKAAYSGDGSHQASQSAVVTVQVTAMTRWNPSTPTVDKTSVQVGGSVTLKSALQKFICGSWLAHAGHGIRLEYRSDSVYSTATAGDAAADGSVALSMSFASPGSYRLRFNYPGESPGSAVSREVEVEVR